jgi:hypothetical protein
MKTRIPLTNFICLAVVEGPLEKRDEELEELIREELRQEVKEGAKAAGVAKLVAEANHELDETEKALEG